MATHSKLEAAVSRRADIAGFLGIFHRHFYYFSLRLVATRKVGGNEHLFKRNLAGTGRNRPTDGRKRRRPDSCLVAAADCARRRIPRHWPLSQRLVANSEERKVWGWLAPAFSEHSVMIKMPVTRFTLPITKKHGQHWYELLSALYCTFTVVTADGQVIGCVDVSGQLRLAKKNRILKETLLNQCGIAYIAVDSTHLPSVQDIRTEFLGDMASMPHDRARTQPGGHHFGQHQSA
ncbi:DUF2726 domain-containing protein [Polaromonas sp. P1(28)-13]|nr:DUF2726 domain-containing protein [Polaromonas sp. P1(28)-13]